MCGGYIIIEEEVSAGGLTELQYHDDVRLIRHAAKKVYAKHRKLCRRGIFHEEKNIIIV